MIGVFDSGVGGLISYRELRRLLPKEDIVFLADRRNAPYGTKTEEELISLVRNDIKRLRNLDADEILIACCTASTVYGHLSKEEQASVTPIITPTAEFLAKEAEKKAAEYRVAVIATNRTCASGAFKTAVNNCLPSISVTELPVQELVSLVEKGARDGKIDNYTEIFINSLCEKIKKLSPDALVLGCTHFSHLRKEFERRLSGILTVSPAHIGARKIYRIINNRRKDDSECGRCLYTE